MNSDLIFYKSTSTTIALTLEDGYSFELFKPSLFHKKKHHASSLIYWFWFVLTRGSYFIFYIKDSSNSIVHYSHVLTRFYKFSFLSSKDYQIGPCWTAKKHRGKGLYPFAINKIMQELQHPQSSFWMFTSKSNIASQKGIEKSSFNKIGFGYKSKISGSYILAETN